MDFAKAQLIKYGWQEGKGLGKDEEGITQAIKPKLKFDKAGVGHDGSEVFTHYWWEHSFNEAAKNINVCQTEEGISLKSKDNFEITTKKVSVKKRKNMVFNNFLKSATLTNEGTLVEVDKSDDEASASKEKADRFGPILSDEELFKACGGRTAHKGARHGLGLSGKLARIEEQERLLMMSSTLSKSPPQLPSPKKKFDNTNTSLDVENCERTTVTKTKTRKKSKTKPSANVSEENDDGSANGEAPATECPEDETRPKPKKKKKLKLSDDHGNETNITENTNVNVVTSSDHVKVNKKVKKSKKKNN